MNENVLDVHIERAGYSDSKNTITNIQFHIERGELVGLIGANGSGKSTTIKAILNMLEMDGKVTFSSDKGKRYAYVPEQPSFYEELTLWEHLEFAATVCELPEEWMDYANTLLQDFRMDHVIHHLPTSFSKGMQQKLMIILAFMIKPDVYIVDEPFIGLDPKSTKMLLRYLEKEKERGAGILMSTHVLDTAEKYCDRLLLIADGVIRVNGTLADIQRLAKLDSGSLMDCFEELMEW
ncbi:ABC transporter ATP-binding protein [Evansella sp. AB-rgal1]|uniref:ABC transporter ATP-binding protein n=1 Tax=Evansella sp. AB-rgal1 TaxID=3242696 RepID=UPI00359DB40B